MPYGAPSVQQLSVVREFVRDRVVHDFGAGDLVLSKMLVTLGARRVVAVDKERMESPFAAVECVQARFDELLAALSMIDVAFVSWPQNRHDTALLTLFQRAKTCIYLGKNTDGSACGHPELFKHFVQRELLAYKAERRNTLIVYGRGALDPRKPRGEELAGLSLYDGPVLDFSQVESSAAVDP
jgi:hypothetical protein